MSTTFDDQLKKAHGAYDEAVRVLSETDESLRVAEGERANLHSQNAALSKELVQAQADAAATTQLIVSLTGERDKVKGARDGAQQKLAAMERQAGLQGVSASEAIRVPADNVESLPSAIWSKYQDLKKKENEGTIAPGASRKFLATNKAALQKYADAQRGK